MSPTTAIHALRYPQESDPADVPVDMQKLANDVDAALLPTVVNGQWIKGVGGAAVWAPITPADVAGVEVTAHKGQANGYPGLDGSASLPMQDAQTIYWNGIALRRIVDGAAKFQIDAGSVRINTSCAQGINNWTDNRFAINWGTGPAALYVDASYIGTFAYTSDARLKKAIKPLPSTWEAVKGLKPVSFRWRDQGVFRDDGRRHVSFLAQDLDEVLPEAVDRAPVDPDEQPASLNLAALLAGVTKALQEAMARIEMLESKLAEVTDG